MYGREKAWGETDWRRRAGYRWLGELHLPGRLRAWHVMKEMRRLGIWGPEPRAVLDAGGGEGAFAYWLARRFPEWRIVVADNAAATLERGARIKAGLGLTNLELRTADLRHPGDEKAYDFILCTDVLEHIDEDDLVVKHLAMSLKPGGVLLITSPSVPQPRHLALVRWRERRIGFQPSDYGHVRDGYSERQLALLLDHAGLEVDTVKRTFGRFGTLMFDIFFVTGDSRPNPVVFLALFPFYLALGALDLALPGRNGAAVLGVGRKPLL
jgi:2-polyprenyl-3-methyl-5-hydroxy-6-metoxy-1,4-benzoquinol methylase